MARIFQHGARYSIGRDSRPAASESMRLDSLADHVLAVLDKVQRGEERYVIIHQLNTVLGTIDAMREQLRHGVHVNPHRNPPLVIFGNPPRGGVMSENVIAVVYRHVDDDQLYVHGYGEADINPKHNRRGDLVISGLKDNTDVGMKALKDGSVHIYGLHGQKVWDDL